MECAFILGLMVCMVTNNSDVLYYVHKYISNGLKTKPDILDPKQIRHNFKSTVLSPDTLVVFS